MNKQVTYGEAASFTFGVMFLFSFIAIVLAYALHSMFGGLLNLELAQFFYISAIVSFLITSSFSRSMMNNAGNNELED